YLDQIRHIIEDEGGQLDDVYAIMGPWDFLSFAKYPDNETAFRVLAKIAKLDVVKTETFPAEKVDVFLKALVQPGRRRGRTRPVPDPQGPLVGAFVSAGPCGVG